MDKRTKKKGARGSELPLKSDGFRGLKFRGKSIRKGKNPVDN